MIIPPIEPSSDARQLALSLRQLFEALTATGFTEDQAMGITLSFIELSSRS